VEVAYEVPQLGLADLIESGFTVALQLRPSDATVVGATLHGSEIFGTLSCNDRLPYYGKPLILARVVSCRVRHSLASTDVALLLHFLNTMVTLLLHLLAVRCPES
jgi:hypothetical protein